MSLAGERGARIVQGRCLNYGDGITFWPLRDIANGAAEVRADDSPEQARAKLAALIGDDEVTARIASAIGLSTGAFALHEINWAARKFLEKLATEGPLVALVDDIHWAEPAFLDLMEHVLDSAEGAAIVMLATARPDLLERRPKWGDRARSEKIVLKPLSDAAAARVAENLLGASFPADIAARIVAAAEGNPLYVEQILAMLVDTHALAQDEGGQWTRGPNYGEIEIPPTIKALLEARLGQLGREERYAIEPASVIGLQFPAPAVASLAPERARAGIGDQLAALTRKQLVHAIPSDDADLIYRFHHHLVRDTVYSGLLKRARVSLHVDFVQLGRQGERRARPRPRVRGDPRLPPRAGAPLSRRARPARREGPRDRPRRVAPPRLGGPSLVRARRRARGREPVPARDRAAEGRRSAAPAAAAAARRGDARARQVRRRQGARRPRARARDGRQQHPRQGRGRPRSPARPSAQGRAGKQLERGDDCSSRPRRFPCSRRNRRTPNWHARGAWWR